MDDCEALFTKIQVSAGFPIADDAQRLCPITNADDLSKIQARGRKEAYFDEDLPILLTLTIDDVNVIKRQEQAEVLLKSPALQLYLELGYIPATERDESPPSNILPKPRPLSTQQVPYTPLPDPEQQRSSLEIAQSARRDRSSTIAWSTVIEQPLIGARHKITHSVFKGKNDAWIGCYFLHGRVNFPDLPTTDALLLAFQCTLIFKQGLDPRLLDLFDPSSPSLSSEIDFTDIPPAVPRKDFLSKSTGSSDPPRIYARSKSYSYSSPRSATPSAFPRLTTKDPAAAEKQLKAAKARQRKARQDEYAFGGFEEVNLLDSLDTDVLGGPLPFFPSNRLPSAVTSQIDLSISALNPYEQSRHNVLRKRSRGHARSQTAVIASISVSAADAKAARPAPDSLPAIKRSYRQFLSVSSTIDVRMRTLDVAFDSLDDQELIVADDADSEISERSSSIMLSVEISNTLDLAQSFEVQDVTIEFQASRGNPVAKKIIRPLAFDSPLRLCPKDQHNLLFTLDTSVLLEEEELEAVNSAYLRSAPVTVPIDVALSPKETMSTFYQQVIASKTETLGADPSPRHVKDGASRLPTIVTSSGVDKQEKQVCIVVYGRPCFAHGNKEPQYSSLPFFARWNCSLDLSHLVDRESQRKRQSLPPSRLYGASQPAARNIYARSVLSSAPNSASLAGSKRFTMSNLASLVTDTSVPKTTDAQPSLTIDTSSHRLLSVPGDTYKTSPVMPQVVAVTNEPKSPRLRPPSSILERLTQRIREGSQESLLDAESADISQSIMRIDSNLNPTSLTNATESVLITVSLAREDIDDAEGDAAPTFVAESPEMPSSQPMRKGLSAMSAQSQTSSGRRRFKRPKSHVKHLDTFQVEVYVMNRSSVVREFMISVPDNTLLQSCESHQSGTVAGLGIDAAENTSATSLNAGQVGILALEDRLKIGPLAPMTCDAVRIRYLALCTGVYSIEELIFTDLETGQKSKLVNALSVVVDQQ